MKKLSFLPWLVLFISLIASAHAQNAPHFEVPERLANGSVDLAVTGSTGTNYTIEASENLSTWFDVTTGAAVDGGLSFRHENASNYGTLFYRARMAVDLLPPVTVGLRLNTNTTLSALASVSGASAELFGATGTRYVLTLPTNSIPEAQVFTMTEVTNITGLPFAGGAVGVVRIDPADLVFWGAATLEISFRTNIDRRRIASFTCQADGSGFHLMFDRVGTNRIVIPITRAGVYGSVIATEAELNEMARHEIGSLAAEVAALPLHAAVGAECQAAKKAAAKAAEKQLSAALAAKSQAAAVRLGVARQQQLLGVPEDSIDALSDLSDQMCDFYTTHIAPRWPEAASNCALGRVLSQFTIGLARQRALLGETNDTCIDFANIPFCVMFENCLKEIRECCEAGNRGAAKVAEVYGLTRQDALMGSHCINEAEAQEVIDLCSSNVWTGTFSVQASAHTNVTTTSGIYRTTIIESLDSKFSGAVIESTEFGTEATGYTVQLRVAGQISVDDYESQENETAGECGPRSTLRSSRVVAAGHTEYQVSLSTRPDGSYLMFSFNRTDTHFGAPATETDIELQISHSCDDGSEQVKNKTTRESSGVLGYSLPLFQGTWSDPNTISGANGAVDAGPDPDVQMSQQWSFSRRKGQ